MTYNNKNQKKPNENDIVHSSSSSLTSGRKPPYRGTSDNNPYLRTSPYDRNQMTNNKIYQSSDTVKKLEEGKKKLEEEIDTLKHNLSQSRLSYEQRCKELQYKYDDLQLKNNNFAKVNKELQYKYDDLQLKNNNFAKVNKELQYKYDDLQLKNNNFAKKIKEIKEQHLNQINNIDQQHEIQIGGIDKKYTDRINDISEVAQQYQKRCKLQEQEINELRKSLESQKKSKLQEQQEINELRKSLESKEKQIQNLEVEKKELDSKNEELQKKSTHLKGRLEDLVKQNAQLEDEASNYQSALGVATNCQLGDDDQNHAVKFNNDILELIDRVKIYVTNLKGDITVNMEEIRKLLLHYNCPTEVSNQKVDRLLIQAVLQRHVLETIFSYASQYFQNTGQHFYLESDIVNREYWLSELLTHASEHRDGNDEITRVAPMKLRQQIYSILSIRGFSDIIGDVNDIYEHPFISHHKETLNKMMNELRIVNDKEKVATSENLAADIIRDVVRIFWFRMKVQEPVLQFIWIPLNTKVDKTFMEGSNLSQFEDNLNLYVDLCYFPLIGRDLVTNNRKIYTPAQVFVRKNKGQQVQQQNQGSQQNQGQQNRGPQQYGQQQQSRGPQQNQRTQIGDIARKSAKPRSEDLKNTEFKKNRFENE